MIMWDVMAVQFAVLAVYLFLVLMCAFPVIASQEDDEMALKRFFNRVMRLTWVWLFIFVGVSFLVFIA